MSSKQNKKTDKTLLIDQTVEHFEQEICEDFIEVWKSFKKFLKIPVIDSQQQQISEQLLFNFEVDDQEEYPDECQVLLAREFIINPNSQDEKIIHFYIDFDLTFSDESAMEIESLKISGRNTKKDLPSFVRQVEKSSQFKFVKQCEVTNVEVTQHEVPERF